VISYDDFRKCDVRIGTIASAERIPETDKLVLLTVDIGSEKRQIVAGIADTYEPGHLVGKKIPVLVNLVPRKIRGVESHGMILAVDVGGKAILLHPERDVPAGSTVR